MKHGDVSVIVPNRDRTSALARCLCSIAGQTLLPSEVIVVDDHSQPEQFHKIQAIVASFRPLLNIALHRNDRNLGANASRNRGIAEAKHRYVAFLDSDDIWLPVKLEIQMAAINATAPVGRYVLSSTGRYRVDQDGTIMARQYPHAEFSSSAIRASNIIGTLSSVVVDATVARLVAGFDEELRSCQDWDFYIRLHQHVEHVGVKEPLCVYVEHHDDRISTDHRRRLSGLFSVYRKHIRVHKDSIGALSELYRNIAEEYQRMGRLRKAREFYVQSLSRRAGPLRMLPRPVRMALLHTYYRISPVPSLRDKRYARYRRQLTKTKSDMLLDREMDLHQEMIYRMMHLDEFTIPRQQGNNPHEPPRTSGSRFV